jgi:RNase P subunit RPR2
MKQAIKKAIKYATCQDCEAFWLCGKNAKKCCSFVPTKEFYQRIKKEAGK